MRVNPSNGITARKVARHARMAWEPTEEVLATAIGGAPEPLAWRALDLAADLLGAYCFANSMVGRVQQLHPRVGAQEVALVVQRVQRQLAVDAVDRAVSLVGPMRVVVEYLPPLAPLAALADGWGAVPDGVWVALEGLAPADSLAVRVTVECPTRPMLTEAPAGPGAEEAGDVLAGGAGSAERP